MKAGNIFTEAAFLFGKAGDLKAAKETLLKAYDCFERKRLWYAAAKTLEQVIQVTKEDSEEHSLELQTLAWKTASVYVKAGQPDSAAYVLEKVAKMLEEQAKDNYSSAVLLEKAVEIVETENRPLQAAHYQTKLLQMDLDNDQLNECTLEKARKLVHFHQEAGHKLGTGFNTLGLVMILVSLERYPEAEKVTREYGNYCSPEQILAMEKLVSGCEQRDQALLHTALNTDCVTSLKATHFNSVLESITKFMVPPEVLFIGALIKKEDTIEELINDDIKTGEEEEESNYSENSKDDNVSNNSPNTLLQLDIKNSNLEEDRILEDNASSVVRQTDDGVGSTTINQKPKKNSKLERSATLATCYLKAKPPSPSSPPPVSLLTSIEMSRPERERAIHMTPRSTENIFSDVTGFDIAPPRLFGMTLDQRREFLRSNSDNYCIVDED